MKDLELTDKSEQALRKEGGTEAAFMSTTTSPEVAIWYSLEGSVHCSMLVHIRTDYWKEVGSNISFLSAFPNEAEIVYPPNTSLVLKNKYTVRPHGLPFLILEMKPSVNA